MSKYSQGKIYKLTSSHTDKVYIGSTTKSLNDRFSAHKCHYKRWLKSQMDKITSYDLLQYTDVKIELIKEFPCETRTELEKEEGKLILENNCVNRYVAGRTKKEYDDDNKDKYKIQRKEYRAVNKDKIKIQKKEYRAVNKDKIKERKKEYYQENKEKFKAKCKCECGGKYTHVVKSRHLKSKKHQAYILNVEKLT
jgi:hypothetical protein